MGVAITGGGRVSLLADGEQLSLDPVDQSDEGIYMCIVSNSVGSQMFSDSYTIRLDVQGKGGCGFGEMGVASQNWH